MAREKQRNSQINTISIIIISFLILILIIFNIYNLQNINKQKQLNENYSEKINSSNKTNKEVVSVYNDYTNKINDLNNIEKNFEKLKIEYFSNIKKLEDNILSKKSNTKIAYLTFDDGPYYLTYEYLKVLKKYNINATFFNIGNGKTSCYDKPGYNCYKLYKEITNADHTIANHTYSHLISRGLYNSTNSFIIQVNKMETLIKQQTGITTNIIRFPGGSATAGGLKKSIISELRKKGYGWVDWTAADGDGGSLSSASEAMSNIKSSINSNIEVVLLHDYNRITLSVLPDIIEYLQDKEYILLPLFYESNMINK